jgi:hypothetical protein
MQKKSQKTPRNRRASQSAGIASVPSFSSLHKPQNPILFKREVEVKTYDTIASAITPTWSHTPIDCFAPVQGINRAQRIGDEASLIGWELRASASATATPGPLRVILWQYNDDTAGGAPALTDVLQTSGALTTPIDSYQFNAQMQRELVILHDSLHYTTPTSERGIVVNVSGAFQSRVRFNSTAVTGTGKLYLSLVGNAAAPGTTMTYYVRVFYTDL